MKKSINRFLTPTLTILIVTSAMHFHVRRHVTARAADNMDAANGGWSEPFRRCASKTCR